MSLSTKTKIYRTCKKLGLSPTDIDSSITRKISDNTSCNNASNIDVYKHGGLYASVSPKDF